MRNVFRSSGNSEVWLLPSTFHVPSDIVWCCIHECRQVSFFGWAHFSEKRALYRLSVVGWTDALLIVVALDVDMDAGAGDSRQLAPDADRPDIKAASTVKQS
jgi:hypothetical protein